MVSDTEIQWRAWLKFWWFLLRGCVTGGGWVSFRERS